jgi:cytochrome c5
MQKFIIFLISIILLLSAFISGCSQSEQTGQPQNTQLNGGDIFKSKCATCHSDKSKFEEYLGQDADAWKKGVQKMIESGFVKLTEEEKNTVSEYLASEYKE